MCGGGKSSSSSTQTTQQSDLRVAGGDGSTNISAQSSTVTLSDHAAIDSAFGFARDALAASVSLATSSSRESLDVAERAQSQLADAWSTAKAGEQRILVVGGLVIAGIVAVKAIGGKL